MISIKEYLCLSAMFLLVKSFQPACVTENQFRLFCFPVEFCNDFECGSNKCGYYPPSTNLVRIKDTKIIPTCAFSNSDNLVNIDGRNKGIEVIASRSFVKLPNLKNILLSFNLIRDIHNEIFLGVSTILLDLSWNKIMYIDDKAFQGLYNLKYLNLSKNELKTLPLTPMPQDLIEINLSHNFFDNIIMTSKKTPNIVDIDLSNNVLQDVAFLFDNNVSTLDLSNNKLNKLGFIQLPTCEELRIKSNQFSLVPQILIYLNVHRMSLHPNPWLCDELHKLGTYLQNNNIVIKEDNQNERTSQSICVKNLHLTPNFAGFRNAGDKESCDTDENCKENMICRSQKCWDPCTEKACDNTSACEISQHKFTCACPKNLRRNPKDVYSPCLDIQCLSNADCDGDKYCSRNNTCIEFRIASGGSPGVSHSVATGASNGGFGGYYSGAGAGGFSGGALPGGFNGYSGSPSASFGGVVGSGFGGNGLDGDISQKNPVGDLNKPWWYDEIPKVESSNIFKETRTN